MSPAKSLVQDQEPESGEQTKGDNFARRSENIIMKVKSLPINGVPTDKKRNSLAEAKMSIIGAEAEVSSNFEEREEAQNQSAFAEVLDKAIDNDIQNDLLIEATECLSPVPFIDIKSSRQINKITFRTEKNAKEDLESRTRNMKIGSLG